MIYFIQSETLKLIKIGYCEEGTAEKRKAVLQCGSADNLILLTTIPHKTERDEHELHIKFKDSRYRGEWFEPDLELMQFIENVKKENMIYEITLRVIDVVGIKKEVKEQMDKNNAEKNLDDIKNKYRLPNPAKIIFSQSQ